MKIIVACGGTGGHSFPGLAVAEELLRRGHEVVVWSSGRAIESSVMKRWPGPVFATGARTLGAKNLLHNLYSILRCRREMRRMRPDALLAMGSYASLPPVLAARWCGVKVYLHEANTVPGRAVDFLSGYAEKVAISFEMTANYLPKAKTVVTGLPVRADIALGQRFEFIPPKAFTIFITGGSQGAHAVNVLMKDAIVLFKRELDKLGADRPLYIIHQTGAADEAIVQQTYQQHSIPARVHAFEREMNNAFASADLVVARAGASTCFELASCGKPALLIPLPSALRNHQHFNADAFAAKGAADEGIQLNLTPRQLERYLMNSYLHPERLDRMSAAMKALATPDAAARVAELIIKKTATNEANMI